MFRIGRLWITVLSVCVATAGAVQSTLSARPEQRGSTGPTVAPQPEAIDGATTYVYKSIGDVHLRLHVFAPSSTPALKRNAAILFFFGGGWTGGTVQQFVPQSKHLADRGMVAAVADYRVFGRHRTNPVEAMTDAKSAIRWVRSHAKELGIDPDRLAASGGSSGGHIALSTAIFDAFDQPGEDRTISSKPNALVLFNPAVDTTRATPELLKQRFGEHAGDASPLHHLARGLPPMVIFHGKADTTVPYADVEKFCAAASKLRNRCELYGYEGAPHGFFNPSREGGKWYRETLLEMDRFLTKIGYLREPASTR